MCGVCGLLRRGCWGHTDTRCADETQVSQHRLLATIHCLEPCHAPACLHQRVVEFCVPEGDLWIESMLYARCKIRIAHRVVTKCERGGGESRGDDDHT